MRQLLSIITHSESETYEFAKGIAKHLNPSAIVLLDGNMGMGKSVFARGIIHGLGYEGKVTSPTFTLMNEYPTDPPVYHFDMYRLESPEQLYGIGYEEYVYSDGIALIEWAEKMEELYPDKFITVRIEELKENERQITVLTDCDDFWSE